MAPMRPHRRARRRRAPPLGTAKMAGPISNKDCDVSGAAEMVASPCAWACGIATGVRVWRRLEPCRRVSRSGSRGSAGSWPIARAPVAAPEDYAWSRGSVWCPWCLAPVRCVRPSKRGGSSRGHCPCWGRNLGGRRTSRHAAGMGTASCGRSRWSPVMSGSRRRRCALSWCIRVNWRSSKPSPLRLPKRRQPKPWPTTSSVSKPRGLPASPTLKPPSQSMRAAARDAEGAVHVLGAITPYTLPLLQTPAVRAVLGGDVQRRRTRHRLRRAIASWWRWRR